MEWIIAVISSGPATVAVVVLAVIVLHKTGALKTLLEFLSQGKVAGEEVAAADIGILMKKMDALTQYANHDTTKLLEEIRDGLRDNFSKIHSKHAEWEKYGINARCEKKS